MKELFKTQPPFIPANPVADLQRLVERQVEALGAISGLLQDTSVTVVTLRAAFRALVLTHHAPAQLAEEFQSQLDLLADKIAPDRIELYREEAQQLHQTILAAVNRPR